MVKRIKLSSRKMKTRPARPLISILTPVLNEAENLDTYFNQIEHHFLNRKDIHFEIILVDDGSVDASWDKIIEAHERDPRIQGIRLSRNFGSHLALMAAFEHSRGDAAVVLACDLQDPPQTVLQFIESWKMGNDIVWGRRQSRQDSLWRIGVSKIFHWLIKKFAMPKGSKFQTGSFLLADRIVVDTYIRFREVNRITFAIVASMGFSQSIVDYDREQRVHGKSRWRFDQMVKTLYDAFIGFSYVPIRLITWLGVLTSIFALVFSVYLLCLWVLKNPIPGWTSQLLFFNFFFGLQFFLVGIIGEYLYRIYAESIKRPLYITSEWVGDWESEKEYDHPSRVQIN